MATGAGVRQMSPLPAGMHRQISPSPAGIHRQMSPLLPKQASFSEL